MLNRSKSKTYRNWHDSISKAFSKNFVIPKNYTVKNDSITYVSADFIINRSGHVDSLILSSIGGEFTSFTAHDDVKQANPITIINFAFMI